MAAGLGFKTFTTGEVLTAADTNGYLMQGVLVFATAAARNAAITSPQEGQFAYTKDTNGLWYYDGAAWVASGATGDIEGVTAGTGISGGGTSGTVTITNSMATEIAAKADLIVGTGSATFDNLTVGANGTVLTADSTVSPTGLKWATVSSGGMTLLSTTTLSGATVTVSGISGSYKNLVGVIIGVTNASADGEFQVNPNGANVVNLGGVYVPGGVDSFTNQQFRTIGNTIARTNTDNAFTFTISNYANTTNFKPATWHGAWFQGSNYRLIFGGVVSTNSAITSIVLSNTGGSLTAGTLLLYGES